MVIYLYAKLNILSICGTKNITFKKTKLTLNSKTCPLIKKIYTLCNDIFEVMQLLYVTIFSITYNTIL